MNNDAQELVAILARTHTLVGYSPMEQEIKWTDIPHFFSITHHIETPLDAAEDPFTWAMKIMRAIGSNPAVILVPGKKFDVNGARIGRGGGWYDKFLSKVPPSWTRIGMLHLDDLSKEPLPQESWDEKMDFLCIQQKDGTYAVLDCRKK